jgi:DeoR family suf operon transcriptional repressor
MGRYTGGMSRSSAHSGRSDDTAVIDLMRLSGTVGIAEVAEALGVTATAVRLRLDRLVRNGLVERVPSGSRGEPGSPGERKRGRPAHGYRLTPQGRLTGGDNFHDLAMVLWDEVRGVRDPAVRRGLLGRIGRRLADRFGDAVNEQTPEGRLEQVAGLLRERSVSCGVSTDAGGLAVLTSHSCPYPELADRDRGICAAERQMLEQLTGASVRLTECRLDGDACCRFTATAVAGSSGGEGIGPVAAQRVRSAADGPKGPARAGRATRLASGGDSTSNSCLAAGSAGMATVPHRISRTPSEPASQSGSQSGAARPDGTTHTDALTDTLTERSRR